MVSFFVKRTFARTRTRDAPRGSCRRSRLRGLRERQTQASLRSSLVFRSKKRLPSGGLFFFVKRTFTRTRTRDAPRGSCRRSRLRGLRERQTQASLRSSLVFRSGFSLTSVGLFPYISVSYAALAWLCRRSGLFLTLQRNFRKSGEKRVISGECFTLCLTLENNICKVKLNLII